MGSLLIKGLTKRRYFHKHYKISPSGFSFKDKISPRVLSFKDLFGESKAPDGLLLLMKQTFAGTIFSSHQERALSNYSYKPTKTFSFLYHCRKAEI